MAEVPVSVKNWLIVGLMAMTFALVVKLVLTKFPVKGLTDIAVSA